MTTPEQPRASLPIALAMWTLLCLLGWAPIIAFVWIVKP